MKAFTLKSIAVAGCCALTAPSLFAMGNIMPPTPQNFVVHAVANDVAVSWTPLPDSYKLLFTMDGAPMTLSPIGSGFAYVQVATDLSKPHTFTLSATNNAGISAPATFVSQPLIPAQITAGYKIHNQTTSSAQIYFAATSDNNGAVDSQSAQPQIAAGQTAEGAVSIHPGTVIEGFVNAQLDGGYTFCEQDITPSQPDGLIGISSEFTISGDAVNGYHCSATVTEVQ